MMRFLDIPIVDITLSGMMLACIFLIIALFVAAVFAAARLLLTLFLDFVHRLMQRWKKGKNVPVRKRDKSGRPAY